MNLTFHVQSGIASHMQLFPRKKKLLGYPETHLDFSGNSHPWPQQAGKTTLVKTLTYNHYFDLENPRDAAALEPPQLALEDLEGLFVIDEIPRAPELFRLLRHLVDIRPVQKYAFLGSASPVLLKQSAESLAGRISYFVLGGPRLSDVGADNLKPLWLRRGPCEIPYCSD